jgi:hypothetical protein
MSLDVTGVVDREILEPVDAHRERRARAVVREVAALPDVLRAENDDVGVAISGGIRPIAPLDAQECDVRAELGSPTVPWGTDSAAPGGIRPAGIRRVSLRDTDAGSDRFKVFRHTRRSWTTPRSAAQDDRTPEYAGEGHARQPA